MLGSGMLDALVAEGVKYLFVSNSDNLGATLDLQLLQHFAGSGAPFMMEARRARRLALRRCPASTTGAAGSRLSAAAVCVAWQAASDG